jgi:hypothetical protein
VLTYTRVKSMYLWGFRARQDLRDEEIDVKSSVPDSSMTRYTSLQ